MALLEVTGRVLYVHRALYGRSESPLPWKSPFKVKWEKWVRNLDSNQNPLNKSTSLVWFIDVHRTRALCMASVLSFMENDRRLGNQWSKPSSLCWFFSGENDFKPSFRPRSKNGWESHNAAADKFPRPAWPWCSCPQPSHFIIDVAPMRAKFCDLLHFTDKPKPQLSIVKCISNTAAVGPGFGTSPSAQKMYALVRCLILVNTFIALVTFLLSWTDAMAKETLRRKYSIWGSWFQVVRFHDHHGWPGI